MEMLLAEKGPRGEKVACAGLDNKPLRFGVSVSALEHKVWPLALVFRIITELRGIVGIMASNSLILQMYTMRPWRWSDCLPSFYEQGLQGGLRLCSSTLKVVWPFQGNAPQLTV